MKKNNFVISAVTLTLISVGIQKEPLKVNAEDILLNNNTTTTPASVSITNNTTPSAVSINVDTITPQPIINDGLVITPSTQTVNLNENPLSLKITNVENYIPKDEYYYFIYTTDGTEPDVNNKNVRKAYDYNKYQDLAILPSKNSEGTMIVKVKRVEYNKAVGDTYSVIVKYVKGQVEQPILTSSNQELKPNNVPAEITIDNYSYDKSYYYTIDGSNPTTNSNKVTILSSGNHGIQIPTQSTEGAITVKVIAVDGYNNPSDISTAQIVFKKDVDMQFMDFSLNAPVNPMPNRLDGGRVDILENSNNTKNKYKYTIYKENGQILTQRDIPNTDSKSIYIPEWDAPNTDDASSYKVSVTATNTSNGITSTLTKDITLNYSAKIFDEQTPEPIISGEEFQDINMGDIPKPFIIDKNNVKPNTKYYYTFRRDDYITPLILPEYEVHPDIDGNYIIQPPVLNEKESISMYYGILAVEDGKAPSITNHVFVDYNYDALNDVSITPPNQVVGLNEPITPIIISNGNHLWHNYPCIYTTDGTEPTMDNPNVKIADFDYKEGSDYIINIPTQSVEGSIIINVRMVDDGDGYMSYKKVFTTKIDVVKNKTEEPILSPATQTVYIGSDSDYIYISNSNKNKNIKYYYTTDGSIPTTESKQCYIDDNGNYKIKAESKIIPSVENINVIAVEDYKSPSNVSTATVTFINKLPPDPTPVPDPTPTPTPDPMPTPTPNPSHNGGASSSHHNSEIKLIDVYKNNYIKNTDTKISENNYSWSNTTDNLNGTLTYTDDCYTVKMDKDFDKGTHVVIYDNFKGKPAKLYSYIPDIGMYALLKDDVTATDGTLKFDTTNKGEYVITSNELSKDKVLNYWYSLGYNKWIFFNKYSDERLTGWHKAQSGEWMHNGVDSMGDSFHMGENTIMDMGWFKDKDGSWYYLDNLSREGINSYGAVLKGWYYLNNNWYYFNTDSGKMTTGWCKINNNWYYFNSDGAMQSNTTIDGYQLNEHGQLINFS